MTRRTFLELLPLLAATTPNPPLRVGILGHTGRGNFGHGLDTAWLGLPTTSVVAVADPAPTGLAAAQTRLGPVQAFADPHTLLETVRPELVSVCPRHVDQHHAWISAAIHAGVRGIYVEKPFVRTPAEADEIAALCREKGVALAVAHRNRYHPVLPLAKRMLQGGDLGELLEFRARGKEDHRGGILDLWVLGSHLLNLACFLSGPPEACSATVFEAGRPLKANAPLHEGDEGVGPLLGDEIHARYEMPGGVPLFFDSRKGAGRTDSAFGLQAICTRGILDFRIDVEPLVHVLRGNPLKPHLDARSWVPVSSAGVGVPEPRTDMAKWISSHRAALEDLLESVQSGRQPLCGPEEGRWTVEMIHGALASHRAGGSRVPFPLSHRGHALG
jgi:predicted dehydrogenase